MKDIKHLDFDSIESIKEFEDFIKANPAEISKKDKWSHRTWLHEAVTHTNFFPYAEILINYGANPQLKDADGKTVLALCKEQLRSSDLKQLEQWIEEYNAAKPKETITSFANENKYNPGFLNAKPTNPSSKEITIEPAFTPAPNRAVSVN